MNAVNDDTLRQKLQDVLEQLAQMKPDKPPSDPVSSFADIGCVLIAVRNRVIEAQRRGQAASPADLLDRLNGLGSLMASIEYPLAGIHWKRLDTLRNALEDLLEQGPRLQSQQMPAQGA
jgi:hypothetical protein